MKFETGKYYEVPAVGNYFNDFYVVEGSTIETDHNLIKIGPHIEIVKSNCWPYSYSYEYKKSSDNGKVIEFKSITEITKETYAEYVKMKSHVEAQSIALKKVLEREKILLKQYKKDLKSSKDSKDLKEKSWGKWFFKKQKKELNDLKNNIKRLKRGIEKFEMSVESIENNIDSLEKEMVK